MSERRGILFDIDGTLVDTNYLHAVAWRRAFTDNGHDVPTAWVHRLVGMGSGMLMQRLIGEESEAVKKAWRAHFEELKPEIRALPGAADLLREVARRGAAVVLASSSEESDVEALLAALGCNDVIDCVTSSGDVSEAKPSPEVLEAAIDKSGIDRTTTLLVGDTVWDVKAAAASGIGCVGVLTGGISRADLEEAGALAVYDDAPTLLRQLDESPLRSALSEG